ncbi:MAG TPA: GGDEF domain-containing protein [Candidatus Dormibacteraeota bacterium]|nr:GGDEF domain-containing protein [Candidatus Dormibacteraeota bacterium]
MPSPGTPAPLRLPIEDSYLELLTDTLETLDLPARGQFLQKYLRAITHLDLRENQCIQLWDDMLARRHQMSESLGRPFSLKTALVDVLATAGLLRVPVLIEYDELKKLQMNAVTDPLTGLYNRRIFGETFEKELNRAKRYDLPLGLVILDMHRFKEVNDKHGHPRGDDVLRAAAVTLKKALRTSDSAFRIGGDEFALILPQTDAPKALALSRRIEAVFAETLQPMQLSVAVSIDHGVANYPQDGEQPDQLIRVADERLYRFKHTNHRRTASAQRETPPAETPSPEPAESAAPTPKPISIESKRPPEKMEDTMAAAASATAKGISSTPAPPAGTPARIYASQRKAERVSMSGTNAYAVLGEHGGRRARVLDLGFGGVALEVDSAEELRESTLAILHVPILPPVRVNLKPVWTQKYSTSSYRIGCAFIS